MMTHNWTYMGDVSLREGGFYWRQVDPTDDHVEAVNVYPLREENRFGVISDIIFMPPDKYETALQTCGYLWLPADKWILDCTGQVHTDILPLLVDAFYAYHGLDDTSFVYDVQIGGPKDHRAHCRLAPNASLRKFVEREFL